MRMVPYTPLFSTTTMVRAPYWWAVASSCPFIRKSPSPAMVTTVRPVVMAQAMPAGTP